MDLIGDVRNEPQVVPLDHDIIVCCKLISDGVQARGRLLPRESVVFSFSSISST